MRWPVAIALLFCVVLLLPEPTEGWGRRRSRSKYYRRRRYSRPHSRPAYHPPPRRPPPPPVHIHPPQPQQQQQPQYDDMHGGMHGGADYDYQQQQQQPMYKREVKDIIGLDKTKMEGVCTKYQKNFPAAMNIDAVTSLFGAVDGDQKVKGAVKDGKLNDAELAAFIETLDTVNFCVKENAQKSG